MDINNISVSNGNVIVETPVLISDFILQQQEIIDSSNNSIGVLSNQVSVINDLIATEQLAITNSQAIIDKVNSLSDN